MKPILLLFAFTGLLSSCTQYQYLTVSGVNVEKNEKNELISENDTLKVQYHFTDYKGKVGISIYNKTNQPLEIDWKRSAMIVNGKAWSFFDPNVTIAANLEDSVRLRNRFASLLTPTYLASLNGSFLINEPIQFIPPSSFIYKVPLAMPLEPFQNLPEDKAQKQAFSSGEGVNVYYQKMDFDKTASPLQFRSYLTFRIGGSGAQKEFTIEHNFYISEIWKTASGPGNFPETLINRGDRFYLQP
jgi:hypothetical protein